MVCFFADRRSTVQPSGAENSSASARYSVSASSPFLLNAKVKLPKSEMRAVTVSPEISASTPLFWGSTATDGFDLESAVQESRAVSLTSTSKSLVLSVLEMSA